MEFKKLREFYKNVEEINDVDLDVLLKLKEIHEDDNLDVKFADNPGLLSDYRAFTNVKPLTKKEIKELNDLNNYNLNKSCVDSYLEAIKYENSTNTKHDIIIKFSTKNKQEITNLMEFFQTLNINIVLKTKENEKNVLLLTTNSYDLNIFKKGLDIITNNTSINIDCRYIVPDFKQRSIVEINNEIKKQYIENNSIDNLSKNLGISTLPFELSDLNSSLYKSLNKTNKMAVQSFLKNDFNNDSPFSEINQKRLSDISEKDPSISLGYWK